MDRSQSRYFVTAERMDKAFVDLLTEKEFEFITVKEICEKAEVNRSTFYLHYETIGDLLKESTDYILRKFHSYFTAAPENVLGSIDSASLDDIVFIRAEYLVPYLDFIRENRKLFLASFRYSSVTDDQIYQKIVDPVMNRFQVPKNLRHYYNSFFMHGILAVITEWLKNDCPEEPEEISGIIESLVLRK